jgi:hypothetical protein
MGRCKPPSKLHRPISPLQRVFVRLGNGHLVCAFAHGWAWTLTRRKRGAPGSGDRRPAAVFACALWLYFVGLETLLSDQPYRDLVTTRAAQAIWELIGGNTDRRIIVNFKDGGDHVGRVVSLEDEVLVLQGESDNLFTIQLADVLSVEVIDPDPLTPSSAL